MSAMPVILHVEDDDATAYLVQVAFRQQGIQVNLIRVCNGKEGGGFLAQAGIYVGAPRPDLVLLDLNLPERSGFGLLADIRRKAGFEHIPVLILSSSTQPKDRERAFSSGANEYLVKPADLDGFLAIAKRIFAHIVCGSSMATPQPA